MKKKIFILYLLSLTLAVKGQTDPSVSSYDTLHSYVSERVYLNKEGTEYVDNVTYLDGFGRPLQEVRVNASPGGMSDLIVPHAYGVQGRKEKEYLPFSKKGNNGSFVSDAYSALNWTPVYGPADAAYAYTRTEYDGSPLNRVVKQTGAGSAWHTAGKGVTSAYSLNVADEVRLYKVDLFTGVLSQEGCYRAGSLEKVTVTDEDGHLLETFTDNRGRTVLTVAMDGEGSNGIQASDGTRRLETYYVYDDRNRLRWVLSPEASYRLGTTVDPEVLNRLAYYYAYDRLGHMTEKRLPGCEPLYMVYDKRDRMVLSQDGNQRAADSRKWSYWVYDAYNRVVESGEMLSATAVAHKQLQEDARNVENYLPEGSRTPLQYTVYGSYEATEQVTPHPFTAVAGYASEYHPSVTGWVTSTKTRVLGTETWLTSTIYYDGKCRPIRTISDTPHGGLSTISTAYDFVDNVVKQRETHRVTSDLTDVLETVYTYDGRSRLLSATYTLNSATTATVAYEYDEVGRLIKTHYGDNVTEEMAYNIRGWLTSKESEAFKMKLRYESSESGGTSCYNGNIGEWSWKQGTHAEQLYGFTYDGAGRLKETVHKQKSGSSWVPSVNAYVERGLTYDRNGNLLTLQRTGDGNLVDNLTYTYTGNRLTALEEAVRTAPAADVYAPGTAPNSTYTYDSNGNLLKNIRKSLEFCYNCLHLLSEVRLNGQLAAIYTYSADGTKWGVRSGDGSSGYDYVGSLIYKRMDGLPVLESALFARGQLKAGSADYMLTDHIGSVRAIVDADGTIREQNDYYPFGSRHVNTGYASSGNRYLFSGKERQDLLDMNRYDFGARMYDSDIARWATVDPLAEDYYAQSLFGYCMGNPVRFIDPTGSFATDFYDQYGELIVRTDDGSDDVVVVPEERLVEFKENVYWASSGMLNDPSWNAWWADEFKGTRSYLSSLSFEQLSLLERIDTAWGRRNAIDYWLNPTIGNYFVAQASIVLGQYTNPELLLAGATAGITGIRSVTNNSKIISSYTSRWGRDGKAVEIIYKDGSKKDITSVRVKEWILKKHPNAPQGTMQKVKFDNSIPKSKGYKRIPTDDEINLLNKLYKK